MPDRRECRVCGRGYDWTPNKPGKIYECEDCADEVPVYYAEPGGLTKEDETGVSFTVGFRGYGEKTDLAPISSRIRKEIAKEIRKEMKGDA